MEVKAPWNWSAQGLQNASVNVCFLSGQSCADLKARCDRNVWKPKLFYRVYSPLSWAIDRPRCSLQAVYILHCSEPFGLYASLQSIINTQRKAEWMHAISLWRASISAHNMLWDVQERQRRAWDLKKLMSWREWCVASLMRRARLCNFSARATNEISL